CHEQTRLCEQGEGLVVCDVLAVIPDCVVDGGVGDEEEDQGAVAAVHHTAHEGPLTVVQVHLTRRVQRRAEETPAVVNILRRERERERERVRVREIERERERERARACIYALM